MRRLRGAMGVLVILTALLLAGAGGAVATADTGAGDTASQSPADTREPGSSQSEGSVASNRDLVRTSLRNIVRSATRSLESRRDRTWKPAQQTQSSASGAEGYDGAATVDGDIAVAGDTVLDGEIAVDGDTTLESDEAAGAAPENVTLDSVAGEDVPSLAPDATVVDSPVSEAEALAPVVPVPDTRDTTDSSGISWNGPSSGTSDPVAASPYGPVAQPNPVGQDEREVTRARVQIAQVVSTITKVVVSLGNAVAAVPPVILGLPFSQTPIVDVITLLHTVMRSVTDSATAAAQLPSDFAALFGVFVPAGPVGIGSLSDSRAQLATARTPAVGLPEAPHPMLTAPVHVVDDIDPRSGIEAFFPAALTAVSAPVQAGPSPVPGPVGEQQSLIDRAFDALLVPLSLWALFTGALPGLAGLLVVFGAGTRVGYRQAKAGFAVKVAGIGRFAKPGPLGVVRSGSLVALHQRRTVVGRIHYGRPIFDDQAA